MASAAESFANHLSDRILIRRLLIRYVFQSDVDEAKNWVEKSFCKFDFLLVCLGDEVDDFADGSITGAVAVFDFVFCHNLYIFRVNKKFIYH